MKPMSVLLCGIVLSSMTVPALAQQRPEGWNWRPDHAASVAAWQQSAARSRDFTPPAPRGDLRGDIASNVRTRPEAPHDDPSRRR
ncbi:MAG TPA: hypothetical protein VF573_18275 [Paraburkholderia sp.]|uniref:hypothetical protein n=1 Tax=Paraburkholderia sp. TaxID=1926495 RepID=UPI002ED576E4